MHLSFIKQDDSLEKVILVDGQNRSMGVMDKLLAHQEGHLHRAFSIFIFNKNNQLLIQKRNSAKYHSPSQWANSCCGHPRQEEACSVAAQRRLLEEMGLQTKLTPDIAFIYKVSLSNGWVEHEFVQFFKGITENIPKLNPFEASDYLWICQEELFSNSHRLEYTPWFQLYLNNYKEGIQNLFLTMNPSPQDKL